MKTFGEKLRECRKAAGMTQEELAKKCGLKKQSISRYEKSEREPNIQIAHSLALALGVSLSSLVDYPTDGYTVEPLEKWAEKDMRLLNWFRSLPVEKQKAILTAQDAPTDLV